MLRSVMAVVFAVLWAPLTAHCKLECLPGLEFLHCPSDTPSSSDCTGDGCQVAESGLYKLEDSQSAISFAIVFLLLTDALPATEQLSSSQLLPHYQTDSAPGPPRHWQFSFR